MGRKKNDNSTVNKLYKAEQNEIQKLLLTLKEFKPKITNNPFSKKLNQNKKLGLSESDKEKAKLFSELPLSKKIQKGLRKSDFVEMTDIQRESLPYSLSGYDVLGAAKTGSGKTLAFLIPVIDRLYQQGWNPDMGLGALILVPTRELGLQIFDVLRKIGRYHNFSAGLVLGGKKNFNEEMQLISRMNILVATPGRLLQHLNESFGFNGDNLQLLVLDEADRLLEMGFESDLNAIIQYLNPNRQTLLFSATQDEKTNGLARLSLRPKATQFISMIKEDSLPDQLKHLYTKIELYEKVDLLFSFLKKQTQQKSIVFLSTNAQVSFLYEAFSKLPLGMRVYKLKGNMSQTARDEQYANFADATTGVMFATDIAARGLDFPAISFVIQMDIPSNIETYIHRSGRTARLKASGYSIIFVSPEEIAFVKQLQEKEIPLVEKELNPDSLLSISDQLSSIVASDAKMKYLAMRYFEMFVKYIVKGMHCIKIEPSMYPLKDFSQRLGLFEMPKVHITTKVDPVKDDEASKSDDDSVSIDSSNSDSISESDDRMDTDEEEEFINNILYSDRKKAKLKESTRMERLVKKKHTLQLSDKFKELTGFDDLEEDDDFFVVKRNEDENDDFLDKKRLQKAYEPTIKKQHIVVRDGKEMTAFEAVVADKQKISFEEIEKYRDEIKNELSQVDSEDKKMYLQRKRSVDTKREKNAEKEYEAERRKEMTIIREELNREDDDYDIDAYDENDDNYSSDVSMDEETYQKLIETSRQRISSSNRRKFEALMESLDEVDDELDEASINDDNNKSDSDSKEAYHKKKRKEKKLLKISEDEPTYRHDDKSNKRKRDDKKISKETKRKRQREIVSLEEQEAMALQLLEGSSLF